MSRCSIAPSAIRDLDDISDYFLERNIQAGEKFLQEFTKKCRNLATFPTMGKSYWLSRIQSEKCSDSYIFYPLLNLNFYLDFRYWIVCRSTSIVQAKRAKTF
jgi:toxin ParE1/3/4